MATFLPFNTGTGNFLVSDFEASKTLFKKAFRSLKIALTKARLLKHDFPVHGHVLTVLLSGCNFFAYSWKFPAYSGAFLLTIDKFSFFSDTIGASLLTTLAFTLTVGACAFQWESASNKGLKGL